jgi:hypothetical protein
MRRLALSLALFTLTAFGPLDNHTATRVSHSGRGAYEASLTPSGDGFAVAWYDTRHGHAEIYMRVLDATGRPAGPERRLTNGTGSAYEPDAQGIGARLAVAWYEQAQPDRRQTARLGVWTRDGRSIWVKTLSAAGRNGRNPVVRASRDALFCAWLEYADDEAPEVWAAWFDLDGRERQPRHRLAAADRTTWNLNAAIDAGGDAWLVFDAQAGTRADEIFLARVDHTSSQVTRLTADDGFASKYPDLALGKHGAALTWFDERDGNQEVYLFVAPAPDLAEGLERQARRVTHTPGESIGAYVAWNGARVGLAWCDNTPGQHEVYFQSFDEAGRPLGDARRMTDNATESLIPAIRPWRDTFALAWNEFAPGPAGAHGPDGRSEVVFAIAPRR